MSSIICFCINDWSLRCAVTKCSLNAFIFHLLHLWWNFTLNNGPVFLGSQMVGWEPERYNLKRKLYLTCIRRRTLIHKQPRAYLSYTHTLSWLFSPGSWKGAWNMGKCEGAGGHALSRDNDSPCRPTQMPDAAYWLL